MQTIATDKTAFDRPYDPISASGMLRHAVDTEAKLNDTLNGEQPFDRMLFSASTELAITAGALAATSLAFHTVAAESGTSDYLDTIPAVNNTFLFLKAKAGHTIVARHGTGNIATASGIDVRLVDARAALLYCQGGQWSAVGNHVPTTNFSATTDPGSGDDALDGYSAGSVWINTTLDRVWECVDASTDAANWKMIRPWSQELLVAPSAAGGYVQVGISTTGAGSPTYVADSDGGWTRHTTTATPGEIVYNELNGLNYFRPAHSPYAEFVIKTSGDVSLQRLWIGLCNIRPTNVDTIAAGTSFIGFRFSTVAGDAGWIPVVNDGAAQSVGAALTGTVTIDTVYRFKIRVNAALTTAYFSVNGGAEVALSTNFPAIATDVGTVTALITTTAAVRSFLVGPTKVGW